MPDVQTILWIDFESTGLTTDPQTPTALECSWTVTDPAGVQSSPLRQRFVTLPLAENEHRTDIWEPITPAGRWRWTASDDTTVEKYPIQAVRTMHSGNGLAIEHAACPTENLITDWDELDRLLLGDVLAAGVGDMEAGQLTLGGGGVSHYEDRFLRYMAPGVMGLPAMHYSGGLDVSTILRTLTTRYAPALPYGIPYLGKADHALRLANAEHREIALPAGWADIRVEEHPHYASSDRDAAAWLRADADPHRAASGIARALAVYRVLPYLLDELTAGYADALDAQRPVQA